VGHDSRAGGGAGGGKPACYSRAMDEQLLEALFQELVDLPPPEQNLRLAELTRTEAELAPALTRLLRAHSAAPAFLAPPRAATELPSHLGKYRIDRALGQGASGIVYLGYDPDLERSVAIKVLTSHAARGARPGRLRTEARALANVAHPNVAQVYSIEEVMQAKGEGCAILTMEFVPGMTLAKRIKEGPLALEQGLDYGRQIAAALEAAHQRSVIHRDLKPHNIHITPEGWVKVLDFGLAEWLAPGAALPSGRVASGGTPGYMSPEQCRGEAVDERTDLWALGSVLWECLTGNPAVRGRSLAELMAANRRGEVHLDYPQPLPERIHALVRAALEPERERRIASATLARQVIEEELLRLRAGILVAAAPPGAIRGPLPEKRRGHLPRHISSFVGRRPLLDELASRVLTTPLLTLTGPGGTGKTRTILEVAARVEPHFPGGVWFIDLTTLTPGADVPVAVARNLQVREPSGAVAPDAVPRAIVAALEGPALLILDNCEHLAGVDRFVDALLALPAAPTVVATSRHPLGLPGEQVVPIPPLALPSSQPLTTDEAPAEAVELFLDRARSRVPGFTPGERGQLLLGDICRALDGLPLGIELAASYARTLSLEEILARVNTRALATTSPALPARHQSLHNLVEWSYRLLPPKEQALLRALSIFRGGCTLALAEATCSGVSGIETWEVCDLMARLVDQSLVEPEVRTRERSGADGPARYHLLETIRVFADERLAAHLSEREAIEHHYLESLSASLALRAEERTPSRSRWTQRIASDYANIVHALELALEQGRLEIAYTLVELASYYWLQSGLMVDGTRWTEQVLARRPAAPADRLPSAAEARFLSRAGLLAAIQYQGEKARPLVDEAVALARRVGDPDTLAQAHEAHGVTFTFAIGDMDTARDDFEQSRRFFEQAGDRGGMALAVGNLGVVEGFCKNYQLTLRHLKEYRHESRAMGDEIAEAKALQNIGWTAMTLGSLAEARTAFEEALALIQEKDAPALAMVHQNLGDVCISLGDLGTARDQLLASCRIRARNRDQVGLATSIMLLARLADREGRLSLAAECVSGILEMVAREQIPSSPERRQSLTEWREQLASRLGDEEMARADARGEASDLRSLLAHFDSESAGLLAR